MMQLNAGAAATLFAGSLQSCRIHFSKIKLSTSFNGARSVVLDSHCSQYVSTLNKQQTMYKLLPRNARQEYVADAMAADRRGKSSMCTRPLVQSLVHQPNVVHTSDCFNGSVCSGR